MKIQRKYKTLIELFYDGIKDNNLALEIIRTDREEKLSFQKLLEKAQNFALYLIKRKNIKIGDKIAILGKNRIDWDIAFWGAVLAGAIPVLIDPERKVEGLKKHLLQTDTKLLVMADDYQDEDSRQELKDFASEKGLDLIAMTVYEKTGLDLSLLSKAWKKVEKVEANNTAVILCTSGTTGDPREVELTHANLIANLQGTLKVVKITSKDRLLHILPPYHSFGLTVGKLLPYWVGATNIYTNRYHQIPQLIKEKEITIFIGIPALFSLLAKRIEEMLNRQKKWAPFLALADDYLPKLVGKKLINEMGWQKLRFFVSGAAALPKWVLGSFWKRGIQLREGYGTTENSPVYGFNTNPKKLGSVGKPIPTLSVKIVDGKILLGGPCIAKGYYKNPRATQEIFETDKQGIRWLHTGDLGHLDEDGYLYITGRKKFLIVLAGGKNVNPELIELVLSQAEYVKEILVVPAFDKIGQETIKAIVFPDFDKIEEKIKNSPEALKELIWQSIQECQQESKELASFEKISSKGFLEIRPEEFEKNSNWENQKTKLP